MQDKQFSRIDLSDLSLDVEFENCTFVECSLTRKDLSERTFIDCRFENCDLANVTLLNTAFRNVVFDNCKMMGLFIEQCRPFGLDLKFDHCVLDYTSFHGVQLSDTVFENCRLIEADFADADLSGCVFNDCDLKGAQFERTNCEGADFSTSVNMLLDPDNNRLKGAKFALASLPGLLYKYHIDIT